jgi:hypothetical protein
MTGRKALLDCPLPFGHSAPARGYIKLNSTDVWITHSRRNSITFHSTAPVCIRLLPETRTLEHQGSDLELIVIVCARNKSLCERFLRQ